MNRGDRRPGQLYEYAAALALHKVLAVATGPTVIGVTVGEALADSLAAARRPDAVVRDHQPPRAGLLEIGDESLSRAVEDLPYPREAVALAGGAAAEIAIASPRVGLM